MLSPIEQQLSIEYITPAGREILRGSSVLQDRVRGFIEAKEPHKVRSRQLNYVGNGRFSYVFEADGIALKVSSPTTSRDAFEQKNQLYAEDLTKQFVCLNGLYRHLQGQTTSVITPEQYFAVRAPEHTFILAQQYMEGWQPWDDWVDATFGYDTEAAAEPELQQLEADIKNRLRRAIGGFAMRDCVNDLVHDDKLHWGNILLPTGHAPTQDVPVCVIDQPKSLIKV